jgi:hypothetical protein
LKSYNITIRPDTSYEWQESLKQILYYDIKNRLIRRKSWHFGNRYGNDTLDTYFEIDSNDIVIATKEYLPNNTIPHGEQIDYKLDEDGRLTNIIRYYKYKRQFPGVKGNIKDVKYPGYEVDSSLTQLVYNKNRHTIRVFNDYGTETTYYLNRRGLICIENCNPELITAQGVRPEIKEFCNGPRSKTIIIYDRKLRVKSVNRRGADWRGSNKKWDNPYIKDLYTYNKYGLLSSVNKIYKTGERQKFFFDHLTK